MIDLVKSLVLTAAGVVTVFALTAGQVEVEIWSATWCGPCKSLKAYVESEPECLRGKIVIFNDIDGNREGARKANVRSVPTTILKVNGVEVSRMVGFSASRWASFVGGSQDYSETVR